MRTSTNARAVVEPQSMKYKTSRLMRSLKFTGSVMAVGLAIGMSAPKALAQSELELISGTSTVTVPVSDGEAEYNGSVGDWSIDVTVGFAPPTSPPGNMILNSTVFSEAGTSSSLEILWSSQGFTPGTYSVADGGTLTSGITVALSSYYGDFLATTTPLATAQSFSTSPFSDTVQGTASGSSFSITEEALVTGGTAPGSQTSFTETITQVPEPSTIALSVFGGLATLCGSCGIRKRRA